MSRLRSREYGGSVADNPALAKGSSAAQAKWWLAQPPRDAGPKRAPEPRARDRKSRLSSGGLFPTKKFHVVRNGRYGAPPACTVRVGGNAACSMQNAGSSYGTGCRLPLA